jgi:hypothetical protein
MRTISAVLSGAVLGSCTAVPPAPTRTAEAQRTYEQLLVGKVAQRPMSCLPSYRAEDMVRIDDETVAFRDGGTVYVARMRNACTGLTSPQTALVTHESIGGGPCSGDIAQVVDTGARMPVGSCTWGEFVPYSRPRA